MKPDKKLSYSGYSTYVTCPKKYHFHYIEKLRPETISSPLIFGSIVDKALNEVLLKTGKEIEVAVEESKRLFTEYVEVDSRDYDGELVSEEQKQELVEQLQELGWGGDNVDELARHLFGAIKDGSTLSVNQRNALMTLVQASMLAKCSIIIMTFTNKVLPLFAEIVEVQKNVDRGIVDFIAKLKDGRTVIVDNKTASRPYERDAVKWSIQLAGYGAESAMYVVFDKNVRKNRVKECTVCGTTSLGREKTCAATVNGKRCGGEFIETIQPEIIPQIIVDDIPQATRTLVETSYLETEKAIATGFFPRNLNACKNQFGKPCPYMRKCWFNDETGLKKKVDV